ncbi:hypothetical protein HNR62_000327 [Oceanisphaera litoralis]|uniref:hypothetical protein n=1 Tax=Oceanisphaera litoralis TaxID=225144 RepID=UPI00195BD81E|nr:hypothetical protein [Oceanisphaera litoralis]MBM7454498.1 hypothetical protein [Oceanisphaera litoralis]
MSNLTLTDRVLLKDRLLNLVVKAELISTRHTPADIEAFLSNLEDGDFAPIAAGIRTYLEAQGD